MNKEIDQEETSTKARIGWGVKVPTISFEEAIEITKRVSQVGGLEGSLDALAHVVGNSVSSSTFKYKLSTMRNFGLLVFPTGDTYSLSDIGRKLVNPSLRRLKNALW